MITFDVLTLSAFVKEQETFLTEARINKIQQPTRREFIFTLRNNSETRQFYVNINPQFYHCCFMSKINADKRVLEIPQKPPMFCMLLRKYLENSRIAKINQPANERILEFYIETYNEVG
ncbi:MAG: NFACT family protein, partial [Candidatus Gastranaerophilales bacterium]|nr:NFACT family protein [Candidatus Gastranaerophilales bacterium]